MHKRWVVSILPKEVYDASLDIVASGSTRDEAIAGAHKTLAINQIEDCFIFEDNLLDAVTV